ncbi:hypothetical protein OG976_16100 [Mycobacterium sp. NBC_00419]|uniref:hypothetical protein n=1 Tax=Mycobacterium sp. NBC_00419 TaxID=2975989 RepID=UPI002E1E1376
MWWFYTVILGTSFAQVLGEIAVAVREWSRDRERRPFVPALLWQVFLLALIVEVWLAVTYYRDTVTQISILELLGFLAVPAGILIMSFLLPAAKSDPGDVLSPAESFDRVRRVFFGVLIGVVAINLLHGFAIGQQGWDSDLLFQSLIIAGGVLGVFLRRTLADTALAAVMIVVLAAYIGLGYSTVLIDSTG